jgi:hypothetical protein
MFYSYFKVLGLHKCYEGGLEGNRLVCLFGCFAHFRIGKFARKVSEAGRLQKAQLAPHNSLLDDWLNKSRGNGSRLAITRVSEFPECIFPRFS